MTPENDRFSPWRVKLQSNTNHQTLCHQSRKHTLFPQVPARPITSTKVLLDPWEGWKTRPLHSLSSSQECLIKNLVFTKQIIYPNCVLEDGHCGVMVTREGLVWDRCLKVMQSGRAITPYTPGVNYWTRQGSLDASANFHRGTQLSSLRCGWVDDDDGR